MRYSENFQGLFSCQTQEKDALSEAIWNIPNFEDVLSFSMKE